MDAPQRMNRSRHAFVARYLLALGMMVGIVGGCMFFDEIDRCLDRGGRWNDTNDACELGKRRGDEASVSEALRTTDVLVVGRAVA